MSCRKRNAALPGFPPRDGAGSDPEPAGEFRLGPPKPLSFLAHFGSRHVREGTTMAIWIPNFLHRLAWSARVMRDSADDPLIAEIAGVAEGANPVLLGVVGDVLFDRFQDHNVGRLASPEDFSDAN